MGEVKTKPTSNSVTEFLNSVEDEQKRHDSFEILKMMQEVTGEKAVMWGTVLSVLAHITSNPQKVLKKAIGHW